jgi:UDP-glucose 4-epimerase
MDDNQKIVIAGSNGIIGKYLNNIISKSNFEIITIEKKNCDLTNKRKIKNYFKNIYDIDCLIFLVGLAHKRKNSFSNYQKINYFTLKNLLEVLEDYKQIPRKIIFASTVSVYGEVYNQTIYDENSSTNTHSHYGVTKLQAEEYLLNNYSDKSWILRFAPVYFSGFLLNIKRRTCVNNTYFKVGRALRKISLCNINNIVAVVKAIINHKIPEGIYNLSDPIDYSYDELLRLQKANWVLPIPIFAIRFLYYLGEGINNTFLKENTVKLISDNIFPSDKICYYVDLPETINDVILSND